MDRNWIEKHVQGWTKLYQSVDEDAGYRLDDPCKRKSSIQVMEDLIGGDLPKDLKDFFQSVSSCIALKARLSPSLPTDLSQIGNIEFQFSLLGAIQAEKYRKEQAFQTKKGVWQNKIGIILTSNHDVIALDNNYDETHPAVVFICKATEKCYLLAKDLVSFMEIMLYIGAWELNEELLIHILDSDGIDPNCELAEHFYAFFMEQHVSISKDDAQKKPVKNVSPFVMLCMIFVFCVLIPYLYITLSKYDENMLLYASAAFVIVFFIGLIMAMKESSQSSK